ncbi:MAG: N-acetylmuramoyl-L-alanine amidase [Labilithrix sp.]|nr:N-acetylmuramoyl-L-alanine amidase [Labilithrix sp.]
MLRRLAPLVVAVAAACVARGSDEGAPDYHEHGGEKLGTTQSALSDTDPVSAAVDASCTTSAVKGLSTQLIDEIQCMRPGTLASIEKEPGFELGTAVFPWLQAPARQALVDAQKQRGVTMSINSALRALPQQYLLYRWYQTGRCGIGLAAEPGNSNHESALAVDVDDNAAWRDAMAAHDFIWLGSSDPVHFDYKGEGRADIGGLSVLAFQRLWNRNHPEDPIGEDSDYGPATEERLAKAPVGGFAKGADCSAPPASNNPPATTSSGGSGGPLGASGERRDGEGQGCALASAPSPPEGGWLVLAGVALLFVRRTRSRSRARRPRQGAQRRGLRRC